MFAQEDINFLLTNRIPRRLATRFIGWFSQIEQPLVRDLSIACLAAVFRPRSERGQATQFRSMHDCFIRELKDGARPIDAAPTFSSAPATRSSAPAADRRHRAFSGQRLSLHARDLLGDRDLVEAHRNGRYVTLRLTSSMYHRFHAPHDCSVEQVNYISGDTWNVNPIALKRVERLFCKNERAVVCSGSPPAAIRSPWCRSPPILVASIRLHCLDVLLSLEPRPAMS